jgi:glycerate-2-kinase
LALAGHDVRTFCISDVPGDAPRDIGSGPCDADPSTAQEIRAILDEARLWDLLPGGARSIIEWTEAGALPETPKPDRPEFAGPPSVVVASNQTAVRAAASAARAMGYDTSIEPAVLTGDAAEAGRRLGATLAARRDPGAHAIIWGGETTVRLGADAGTGGRCQELALAAALELAERRADRAVLLAAGTDGRDGPTDAAGALISAGTVAAIRAAGLDPARAVSRHDAYPVLDAVEALVRTGPTGTNVMDLVVGLVGP